jgi:hypothetical protein
MASVRLLAFQAYPQGSYAMGPIDIAQGQTSILVEIDTSMMTDPATGYRMNFDISYDTGASWFHLLGATRRGGQVPPRDRQGQPVLTATLGGPLPRPSFTTRQVRGSAWIVGRFIVGAIVTVT